jgi:putative phage-type endonuclease
MKKDRSKFIGGSDIAAAMGVSRWKTPLQLWAEKTGEVEPEDISGKDAVKFGIKLEEFVAKTFTEETGLKVRRAPKNYQHPEYDFMRCQVDRLVTGTEDLLECKTCSAWGAKEWEGEEIPAEYILQVSWQLMITGRKVGYIAVLIGGQAFVWKKIEADQELFDSMLKAAISFWEMVQNKIPPVAEAADNSFMIELFPSAGPDLVEATADMTAAIAQLQLTKAEIIELEKVKKGLEASIKAVIGNNLGIDTPEYTVKWLPTKATSYVVNKKAGRMLRVTKKKVCP